MEPLSRKSRRGFWAAGMARGKWDEWDGWARRRMEEGVPERAVENFQ
jgi:hypothetical protein